MIRATAPPAPLSPGAAATPEDPGIVDMGDCIQHEDIVESAAPSHGSEDASAPAGPRRSLSKAFLDPEATDSGRPGGDDSSVGSASERGRRDDITKAGKVGLLVTNTYIHKYM